MRNTLVGGRVNGVRTAAGIVTGIAFWTLAAGAGIAALVAASHPLFTAIRVAGAAYLVWLGIATLRGRRHETIAARPGSGYRQGLLSNLGNPKIAVFFTSLLPQFASGFGGLAALGLLFCAMGAAWLTTYARRRGAGARVVIARRASGARSTRSPAWRSSPSASGSPTRTSAAELAAHARQRHRERRSGAAARADGEHGPLRLRSPEGPRRSGRTPPEASEACKKNEARLVHL